MHFWQIYVTANNKTYLNLQANCPILLSDFKNDLDLFLISNFRRVLYVVCFLLGNSPASEFYMPTFRNTLSVPSSYPFTFLPTGLGYFQAKPSPVWIPQLFSNLVIIHLLAYEDRTDSVPKRRHIKFRRRGITQKKTDNYLHLFDRFSSRSLTSISTEVRREGNALIHANRRKDKQNDMTKLTGAFRDYVNGPINNNTPKNCLSLRMTHV
jgi:hypothetical protein